jgi:NADPH:quinone reductase-like Zn-dependent oxidoreductase
MKAYQIQTYGGVEGLRLAEVPDLLPGEREVVVRMRAASLN